MLDEHYNLIVRRNETALLILCLVCFQGHLMVNSIVYNGTLIYIFCTRLSEFLNTIFIFLDF